MKISQRKNSYNMKTVYMILNFRSILNNRIKIYNTDKKYIIQEINFVRRMI